MLNRSTPASDERSTEPVLQPSDPSPFQGLLDVKLPIAVLVGTGRISIRRCLALERGSVLGLDQQAGAEVSVLVGGVEIARGEVSSVNGHWSVRLTALTTVARADAQVSTAENRRR